MVTEKWKHYPRVKKLWGEEIVLTNNPNYCSKLMILKEGMQCSLHRHLIKDETFFVLQGKACIELHGDIYMDLVAGEGSSVHIEPGTFHRFYALEPNTILLEVSTQHSDEDVERKEESRKRC